LAEDASHKKLFLLQVVQPGLAGLMDGSVSTLAPLFAAAYASPQDVGSVSGGNGGIGGSGNFDGICGIVVRRRIADGERIAVDPRTDYRGMTTAGGLGHTLPFLINISMWRLRWRFLSCVWSWERSVGFGTGIWTRHFLQRRFWW